MTSHKTHNPYTEKDLHEYRHLTTKEIDKEIQLTHQSFVNWKQESIDSRCKSLIELKQCLEKHKQRCATIISSEMGKPISDAILEVEKCMWLCQHYAENAQQYLADKVIDADYLQSFVTYQPLGIIFAIMPWNFPFWQVLRFAIPTLTAGNACLLKHASLSTGAGNLIQELFEEAGYMPHLFKNMIIDTTQCEYIIANEFVKGVTLTGSEQAGQSVASQAGKHLKKVVLELGGSDPYILLSDADLACAAEQIVKSRLNNAGQVCIAAKRVMVQPHQHSKLINLITSLSKKYKMGDPLSPDTTLGPLASKSLQVNLHNQVKESLAHGATLHFGGEIPNRQGYFYPPTLLDNVSPGMPAFDEELFGPVISIIPVKDDDQAIKLANQSQFGLGAAVFSQDINRAKTIAKTLVNAGCCFVNQLVSSDPRLPFGGINRSGYGRELSEEGIQEFCNIKTVVISKTGLPE
ncbi:NAD-dependent succinate-semialdehyde dehydrogenase [Legionella sp. W05-934-2]|uniref:NAD-dependent succinate-semialdehyde dehydrogenase n=1 Tax=Legionella sp. W05-934-2 TaxID=1198649 RepID=UPI003461E122